MLGTKHKIKVHACVAFVYSFDGAVEAVGGEERRGGTCIAGLLHVSGRQAVVNLKTMEDANTGVKGPLKVQYWFPHQNISSQEVLNR